jgi:hypothetical protein
MNPFIRFLIAALVAAGAPLSAPAQDNVRTVENDTYRYTFTVDQLAYGRLDDVYMTYVVENVSDAPVQFDVCGCGVEFYAVRDTFSLGEDGSEIAGCDACPTCFVDEVCSFDPCEAPIELLPGESYLFEWTWDRQICPEDYGWDPTYGNVGRFTAIAGWNACPVGCFTDVLEIPIEVTIALPVQPLSWGVLKSRFYTPDPPEDPQP